VNTATKKSRAAGHGARSGGRTSQSASIEYRIVEDNGGRYDSMIVGVDGKGLGRSEDFASYEDAEQAARVVRDGAGPARLESRAAQDRPTDLIARRHAPTRGDFDAERWSDEGGSFGSEAVATLPAQR
jgi:hypothetical protein